jgi:peroxiredoxin
MRALPFIAAYNCPVAAVESQMLDLGTRAPQFALPDPDGRIHELNPGANAYVVMFICNHCPFVIHVRKELARLGHEYGGKGVQIVAINSNDIEAYPADSPENMKKTAAEWGLSFPYVYDEDQSVAKAYRAACTPDLFVFDSEQRLVYRGQLDNSRPSNNKPVDGKDLRAALDAVLKGRHINDDQYPSIGCNIKWKVGNEPDYF